MVVLSDLPQVRQLVSVTRMQSRIRAWVFTVPAQPVLIAFLLSLPIVTFLLLHREELLTRLDPLQSHCSPGGAQEVRALLFFFLTALPLFSPHPPPPPTLQWFIYRSVSSLAVTSVRAGFRSHSPWCSQKAARCLARSGLNICALVLLNQ